jgi:hypothetical protein
VPCLEMSLPDQNLLKGRVHVQGALLTRLPPLSRYREKSSGVMARLFDGFLDWRGGHRTGPELEFSALNNTPGRVTLDFQDNPTRRCRNDKFLPSRYSGCLSQFTRKHDSVRRIKFTRRFSCHYHGVVMAWLKADNPSLRSTTVFARMSAPSRRHRFRTRIYWREGRSIQISVSRVVAGTPCRIAPLIPAI